MVGRVTGAVTLGAVLHLIDGGGGEKGMYGVNWTESDIGT